MAKYDPLRDYLIDLHSKGIEDSTLCFKDIERIIGTEMEPSAYRSFTSWDNRGSAKTPVRQNSWLDASWIVVMVDMNQELVKFQHEMRL